MKNLFPLFVIFAVLLLFFAPLVLYGKVPMPAEAFVEHYFPWNARDFGVESAPPIATDVFRQQLPWISLAVDEIKNGRWPLWNPYNFSGMPLMANLQSHVFHPSTILFLLFPLLSAWVMFIVSVPLVAGLSMYVYLRIISRSRLAATFGAVGWMGASFIVLWLPWGFIPYGILLLPLFFWFTEKLVIQKQWRWWPLFVLLLAVEFVSGYAQVIAYALIATVLYWSFLPLLRRPHYRFTIHVLMITVLIAGILLALGLASIQLIPSWEAYQLSGREGDASSALYYQYQLDPKYLATLLAPSFFGNPMTHNLFAEQYHETMLFIGVIMFFFALVAVFRKREKRIWFFLFLSFLAIVLALPTPLADLPVLLNVPILNSGIPSRAIVLLQFSLIVLASFGVDQWWDATNRSFRPAWFFLVTALLILWTVAFRGNMALSLRALGIPAAVLGAITIALVVRRYIPKFRPFAVSCLLVIAIAESTHFFHRNTAFAHPLLIYPEDALLNWMEDHQGMNRHYGEGPSTFDHNFATFYRFFSAEGFDSLYPKRYGETLASAAFGRLPAQVMRSDAVLPKQHTSQKRRLLNLLGVKYIFHQEGLLDQPFGQELREKSTPLFREGESAILENPESFPRAFLSDTVEFIRDREALIERLYDTDFDQRRTILLDEKPTGEPQRSDQNGFVEILTYLPSSVDLVVDVPTDQFLFLSDQWYPGWVARIDGVQTKIYRANDSFRAVFVQRGRHEVVFVYEPESFKIGKKISGFSFIILIGGSIVIYFSSLRIPLTSSRGDEAGKKRQPFSSKEETPSLLAWGGCHSKILTKIFRRKSTDKFFEL